MVETKEGGGRKTLFSQQNSAIKEMPSQKKKRRRMRFVVATGWKECGGKATKKKKTMWRGGKQTPSKKRGKKVKLSETAGKDQSD